MIKELVCTLKTTEEFLTVDYGYLTDTNYIVEAFDSTEIHLY